MTSYKNFVMVYTTMSNVNLQRVQVYLGVDDVSAVTDLANDLRITRSQIIRDATMAVANRYSNLFSLMKSQRKNRRNPLLDLVGIGEGGTGEVGLNVDDIYNTV